MIECVRSQDHAARVITEVAEKQGICHVHRINIGPWRVVWRQRIVMTIQDDDRTGAEKWDHRPGLAGGKANS